MADEMEEVTVEIFDSNIAYVTSPAVDQSVDSPRKPPAIIKLQPPSKTAAKELKTLEQPAKPMDEEPLTEPNKKVDETPEEHVCTECGKSYEYIYSLKRHMSMSHSGDDRPFVCEICHHSFKMNCDLYQHMKLHTGDKTYECTFCGKTFDTYYAWKKHELTHVLNGARNECGVCGCRFPSKQALQKHRLAKECRAEIYLCCKKTFEKRRDYLMHRIQSHPQKKDRYSCPWCDKKFPLTYMLAIHQATHEGAQEPVAPSVVRKRTSLTPRFPISGESKAEGKTGSRCGVCSETFPDHRSLLIHSAAEHKDDKPFVCGLCNKGFTTKPSLQRHERMHANERPYQCDFCDKAFLDAESRRAHRRIHTGEKPYECRYCERRFTRNNYLQSHLLTHTGEKPFICSICDRGFAQQATLKGHMKTHGYFHHLTPAAAARKKAREMDGDRTSREIKRLLMGARETKKAVCSISDSQEEDQQDPDQEEAIIESQCEYELDDNIIIVMQS